MPPASRNHRVPTAGDTPALTAASSLECPVAIAAQNRRCSSRRRTEGRPGERSFARPARSARLLRVVIATPFGAVLRRPVELRQFASTDYQRVLTARGIVVSMSRRGDCWDNAVAESFFATLKVELAHAAQWPTRAKAQEDVFEYLECFYNGRRRHSALRYLSPATFERHWAATCETAATAPQQRLARPRPAEASSPEARGSMIARGVATRLVLPNGHN
jgi:putative transposase